jgi:hypothetical protein
MLPFLIQFGAFIGNGPSRLGIVGRVITLILGILFGVMAFSPTTRLGGAFTYGKGDRVPIGSAGRVITFIIALVMFYIAVRG